MSDASRDALAEVFDDLEAPAALPEPIGFVKRLLTSPDGSKLEVEVPVYPTLPDSAQREAPDPEDTEDLAELLAAEDAD